MSHSRNAPARIAAVAAFLAAAVGFPALSNADVEVGDRAAELVAAKDGKGRRVKLESYRDKIVVLTFGASWCKPCKKELPAWDKVATRYKDRGVVFLAVNIDKDLAKGKAFVKRAKLRAMRAVYESDGATVESYGPPTMPTTYIIDRRGLVRHRHPGYRDGDEKKLAGHLDELVAK